MLTKEQEVLREIAKGRSNKEIARTSYYRTNCETHVSNVLAKLEVDDVRKPHYTQ